MSVERLWRAHYHPARALLLERGLYLLTGLDAWLLMLGHGARYGVGGFNVAHFALLDRLLPLPTPELYLALIIGSGLLAIGAGLFQLAPGLRVLLALAYTLAWALSLHDSYQHHYFLSWLLLFAAWLPPTDLQQGRQREARVSGAALPLCASTCATVYLFTGVSKLSSEWQSGLVLQELAGDSHGVFGGPPALLRWMGVADAWTWRIMAIALVALQALIATGYAICALRDERPRGPLGWWCTSAWLAAWSFHAATELGGGLSIGWFSYYMLWVALVLLAPSSLLVALCRPLALLREKLWHALYDQPPSLLLAVAVASLLAWFAAQRADLPGAREACGAVLALFLGQTLIAWLRGELDRALRSAAVAAASFLALLCALELTSIRFDYYRRAAGELARMGRLDDALTLYRKAERHAPPGRTRMAKIDELQRALEGASDEHSGKGDQ